LPNRQAKLLILIHCCLSLGGFLVHLKIHPPTKSLFFLWASPFSAFSLCVIPVLYWRPSTVNWGVLLNCISVGVGIIGMTYFSIHTLIPPITIVKLLVHSTLADSIMLMAKIPLAYLIFTSVRSEKVGQNRQTGEVA
jgi:hypothetical protein